MMVLMGGNMVGKCWRAILCHKNKGNSVKWFGMEWECRLGCSESYHEVADVEICINRVFRG